MIAEGSWRTRANALSLARLACAPVLAASIAASQPGIAAVCFALAVASDLADGWLARRRGEASALGALLDHTVDATLVTAAAAALAWRGELPAALPAAIALAFLHYALTARPRAGVAPRASALGRANGIAYYAIVGFAVGRDALGLTEPDAAWIERVGWLLVGTTALSIAARLRDASWSGRSADGPPNQRAMLPDRSRSRS